MLELLRKKEEAMEVRAGSNDIVFLINANDILT